MQYVQPNRLKATFVRGCTLWKKPRALPSSVKCQAQVYATVRYGFSLPTERLSLFGVLFGQTDYILSKHTHKHMLIQVYYVTKRVCVACVCVCVSGHSLSCKPVFVLVSLYFFGFSQLLRFFESPIRAITLPQLTQTYANCMCVLTVTAEWTRD